MENRALRRYSQVDMISKIQYFQECCRPYYEILEDKLIEKGSCEETEKLTERICIEIDILKYAILGDYISAKYII